MIETYSRICRFLQYEGIQFSIIFPDVSDWYLTSDIATGRNRIPGREQGPPRITMNPALQVTFFFQIIDWTAIAIDWPMPLNLHSDAIILFGRLAWRSTGWRGPRASSPLRRAILSFDWGGHRGTGVIFLRLCSYTSCISLGLLVSELLF